MSDDPFVRLVDRLSRIFDARHEPAVVAQVTLRCWSQHRHRFTNLEDAAFVDLLIAALEQIPPSAAGGTRPQARQPPRRSPLVGAERNVDRRRLVGRVTVAARTSANV